LLTAIPPWPPTKGPQPFRPLSPAAGFCIHNGRFYIYTLAGWLVWVQFINKNLRGSWPCAEAFNLRRYSQNDANHFYTNHLKIYYFLYLLQFKLSVLIRVYLLSNGWSDNYRYFFLLPKSEIVFQYFFLE